MRSITACFLISIAVSTLHGAAGAQERVFGLGILIGEPTGVSWKYWVSGENALDGGLAWSFRHSGYAHVHVDYLWHFAGAIPRAEGLIPYVGIGGRLAAGRGDGILGVRIPVGLAYWARRVPIEAFLELAPILDLAPATELAANGGIGVRFYFP
jgi:hypothetical protein